MVRYILAAAICFWASLDSAAAEPAPHAVTPPISAGRQNIEALLQHPARLDFGDRQSITIGELFALLHEQRHLSIRLDVPALSGMYGLSTVGSQEKSVAARPAKHLTTISGLIAQATAAAPIAPAAYAQPQALPPALAAPPAAIPPLPGASDPAASDSAALPPPAGDALPPPPKPIAAEPFKKAPAAVPDSPPPATANEKPGAAEAAKEPSSAQDFLKQVGEIEVSVATVDGQTITVGTALRLALDAFPSAGDSEESGGMPLPLTNAMLVDFLVENDGILVTTRLKALTYKETRVYSLKSLKDVDPQKLSTVICQSIRPWSWRSRIDELGEQLKAGASVPPAAIASLMKSGIQLASVNVTMPAETAKSADGKPAECLTEPSKTEAKANGASDLQEAAAVGNAIVNTLITAAHASLTTAEVLHYADPPTGTIRVLPGKLIITQSQAAHREISALLKQLDND